MAHHSNTEKVEFKPQTYLRLISYARPYWLRLTVGIVAGMLAGGSLFFGLMMIPQLVGVVDSGKGNKIAVSRQAQAEQVVKAVSQSNLTAKQKIEAVDRILNPPDSDPQLTKLLKQAESAIKNYRLPCRLEKRTLYVSWPVEFQFELVKSNGQLAWQVFAVYTFVFVFAWLIKSVAHYVNAYCTRMVGACVVADLREIIFKKLSGQSLSFYANMDVGHLISRCTNDTSALEDSISHSVEDLTSAPIQILACFAAILVACKEYNSFSLAVILFIGVPVLIVPMHILGRKIRKIYRKSFAAIADVFSRMHETFSGIKVVKACYTEEYENDRFHENNRKYLKQVLKAMRLQLLVSPTMEFVAVLGTLVFLVYSYWDGVTLTQLAALLSPAFMAYRPIKSLSKVVALIQRSMAAADRFFALLDTDTSLPEKKDAKKLESFTQGIELENVSFRYGDKQILKDINLSIPRGSMVAVVGETGSGKSTIANLIARFYDATSGSIRIDGVDVRDCEIASLRKLIGVVTQEPVLFNESIAENIAYGNEGASREDIINAAKLANAHEFIVSGRHAGDYDAGVGEKGFKLSGGEKQRIAIARAILRNPPILILDEATSALDTVTERQVQEALNRVMANRTVFAIAHRLSTIRHADCIIVLQQGKIAESGTHDELLALGGIYRRLHDTQFSH
ncbi:MAG: ABC transporter ATP-binding protein [Lentisphaeria bacterium]|nr:ABC transporter ATP-binding protein [Lentisphaeria bacterium]